MKIFKNKKELQQISCSSECSCDSQQIHDKAQDDALFEAKAEYDRRNINKSMFDLEALNNLIDISLDDIDTSDYPDFCDAYITDAYFKDGRQLSDEEIDDINDNHRDFVYDCVIRSLY